MKNKGAVGILNVGAGDTKLSFDKNNPAERIRAARVVKDMLRRGYALLVEVDTPSGKKFTRALDFDEAVCEYIIADFDPIIAAKHDSEEVPSGKQDEAETSDSRAIEARAQPTRRVIKKRIPAESAKSVAVARTAGG
jgi:hypothetical protein